MKRATAWISRSSPSCFSPPPPACHSYPGPEGDGFRLALLILRSTHIRVLAALVGRGLHLRLPSSKIRGRREDRVLAAPAVSRAICANKSAHEHTGQREHSGLPCAMALRLTSCSCERLFCHRRSQEACFSRT